MDEAEWERLIHQLQDGAVTPFLGAGASYGSLPTGGALSREWARAYNYPFHDDGDLARVMQFAAVTVRESVYVKERLCRDFAAAPSPDYTDPYEPHALLAEFPIPLFITTNYDDFLAEALISKGKSPNTAICPWYEGAPYDRRLFQSEAGLNPSPERPLVYHLHGHLRDPHSLVLTEEDYLEFLVNIATARHSDDRERLPSAILAALTTRPLLFIGYSLQDWTFRVLFHGLIRQMPGIHRRRHVSVQLLPPVNNNRGDEEELAKMYLTRYLEDWRISIYWGTARQFCAELRQRMGMIA